MQYGFLPGGFGEISVPSYEELPRVVRRLELSANRVQDGSPNMEGYATMEEEMRGSIRVGVT